MSKNNFEDVGEFHDKFGLPFTDWTGVRNDVIADQEVMRFRIKFLIEELQEFISGVAEQDHAQAADALIDLVYVAMGTAHLLGYPWKQLWDDVHGANMRKARASEDGSDSKRGSSWDVIKPEGWVGPRTAEILEHYKAVVVDEG